MFFLTTEGDKWRNYIMTFGLFIRLWELNSALRAFNAGTTGDPKNGGAVHKLFGGAAHPGALFELFIDSFQKILGPE